MVHKGADEFYLVSLSGLDEELSHRYTNHPATVTREEILITLAVYALTRYAQNMRLMRIYNGFGDILCQEAVLYFPSYHEADAVMKRIVSMLLRDAASLPAMASLSPAEKLCSAVFHHGELSLFTACGSFARCTLVTELCYSVQRTAIQEIAFFEGVDAYSSLVDSYEDISHVEILTL
jgi:hypothetical protein